MVFHKLKSRFTGRKIRRKEKKGEREEGGGEKTREN
jgi:hypothetical protein